MHIHPWCLSFFLKSYQSYWIRAHPYNKMKLYLLKDPILKYSLIVRCIGVRISAYGFWGGHNSVLKKIPLGFPGGASGKEPACQCRKHTRLESNPWVRKIPWRRAWKLTIFLPGESHGQRGLVGYSPQGHKESDTTERLLEASLKYPSPSCTGCQPHHAGSFCGSMRSLAPGRGAEPRPLH